MNYRDFQERKKFEHIFYSSWSIFLVMALFFLSIAGALSLWSRGRAIKTEIAELQAEISEAKKAKEIGVKKLEELGMSGGIEAEARGIFNLKKEGEELVIFMDNKNMSEEPKGFWASTKVSQTRVWQNIKNWLGW